MNGGAVASHIRRDAEGRFASGVDRVLEPFQYVANPAVHTLCGGPRKERIVIQPIVREERTGVIGIMSHVF